MIVILLICIFIRRFLFQKMPNMAKRRNDPDFEDFQDAPINIENISQARTVNFPAGHCLVNEKWRNNAMAKNISKFMTVNLVGGLGVVDFHPSPNIAIIYLVCWYD